MRKRLYLLSAAGLCVVLGFGATVARERAREETARSTPGPALRSVGKGALTPLDGESGSGLSGPVRHSALLMRERADGTRRGGPTRDLDKAATLLGMAGRADEPAAALTLLRRALALDLPDTPAGRRMLANLHYRLAGLYDADNKKAYHLAQAGRHAGSEAQRRRLEQQVADLGVDPLVDIALGADTAAPTGSELADTCDSARSAGSFAGAGERFAATGLNIRRGGDREWFAVTVATGEPGTGLTLRAETFSDVPGGSDDDSILELWTGCDAWTHDGLIGFADDPGGNAPLMSRLETSCLAPGTYYLGVGAFGETAKADNIDVEIVAVAACALPAPDAFEPDDDRSQATRVAHSRRRVISEIQDHSVYPPGDEDWIKFGLKRDSLVRIRTACGFPSPLGDFTGCENPPELDTIVELYYASETTTVGLCNQTARADDPPGLVDGRSTNACVTDLDCDTDGDGLVYPEDLDDLQNPFAGLPACLPWSVFGSTPVDPVDNPLAFSDDAAFPTNLGADLTVCLPRTRKRQTTSLSVAADPAADFEWFVRVGGWSPDGEIANSALTFDYVLSVETVGKCNFETEPNNDFPVDVGGDDDDDDDDDDDFGGPDRLTIGESIHGIWDFSATQPVPDFDLYQFDVARPTALLFEIDGFDPIAVDSFIEIIVGPDDAGNFFFTGDSNDDVSFSDLRSRLETFLPPACELLGNCIPGSAGPGGPRSRAGSAYYINVTSAFVVPNFPYELKSAVLPDVAGELTDFGDCGSGAEAPFGVGRRYLGGLDEVCDIDGYKFSLAESAFVRLATGPSGADTVMELRDCNTDEVLACDDDGGPGFLSAMEGCLPGGRDYCVRVRAWDGNDTFDYSIEASGGEPCVAEDPPAISAGSTARCDTFDACP